MRRPLVVRMIAFLLAILLTGCGTTPASTGTSNSGTTEKQVDATDVTTTTETAAMESTVEAATPGTVPAAGNEIAALTEETLAPEPSISEDTIETTVPDSITETIAPTTAPAVPPVIVEPVEEANLTTIQRNSINMLNYITVLTQAINESSGSRVYLESAQSSLLNNIYPNAVDTKTQSQINNLWRTIDGYRMISVKRNRLEYIYDQNRAQALRQAIPNPLGLLSAVQSGGILKSAVSVLYMTVDAKTSYDAASTQADLQYLQNGWELDDAESEELSNSQLNLLNYMLDMVRNNDFPGEYALTVDAVANFVKWTNETNLTRKINWFKANEETYCEFRTYWLELAKSYYQDNQYRNCLAAFERYEEVATRIFRKDNDYAEVIPMAIVSAKSTMSNDKYVDFADKYVAILLKNCTDDNWLLRYFAAQIYVDLYGITSERAYLLEAYDTIYDNVNELVDVQIALNDAYLDDITEIKADKDASKREKQEIKEYNKYLKEKRTTELPPVNEAFYLNCELLFALADELNVSYTKKDDIDNTIHEDGAPVFLNEALDNRFWARKNVPAIDPNDISVAFSGKKLVIPASYLTDRFAVTAVISDGTVLDDWQVEKVDRPKNSTACSEFMVTLVSKKGTDHEFSTGEIITVTVTPVADTPDQNLQFTFDVVGTKTLWVLNGIEFERT